MLDTNIINKLVNLFDNDSNISHEKIYKYIEDERKRRSLDSSGVRIESYVYGNNNISSNLLLLVKKRNADFLHLTLHLSPKSFHPKDSGLIHIFKDIYKINKKNIAKKNLYAIIFVQQNILKPNSLYFSISDINTIPEEYRSQAYDLEIKQEMDVIITVLNNLFDEDNSEYYIGDEDTLFPIHNNTNVILGNINTYTQHVTRKNKGVKMYPSFSNNKAYVITYNRNYRKTHKRKQKSKNI